MKSSRIDRGVDRAENFIGIICVVSALVSLGILGVVIWAVIKLVNHFAA